ncbi:MAG TPA: hypothetical protein VGB51_01945 [Actinomycetota bacterium]
MRSARSSLAPFVVFGASMVVLVAAALPSPAQTTTTVTISYAAESDAAGVELNLADQLVIGGGVTHAEITAAGPKASGFGQGLLNVDQTLAESAAPGDEGPNEASGGGISESIGGLLTIDLAGGTASSESSVAGDRPSTANQARLAATQIAADPVANPLGAGFAITVSSFGTVADASARSATNVEARAGGDGVVISITVDVDVLGAVSGLQDQVCGGLGDIPAIGETLEDTCNDVFDTLTGQQPFAAITVGDSSVSCGWDGRRADADGEASTITVELFGQEPIVVDPGETVTVAEGTPLEITAGAGSFTEEAVNGGDEETDSVSARASGAFLSLFAGQVDLGLAVATCGVSGLITTDTEIARTGVPVLPMLLGGAGIAAAGVSLRRFLRRPR